jgi:hypothetical protein
MTLNLKAPILTPARTTDYLDNNPGMQKLFSRLGLAHRLAIFCGALCLLVALSLALVGHLSSRYILEQQLQSQGHAQAQHIAGKVAAVIGSGDLIALEVTLQKLLAENALVGISVYDVDQRQIGAAGIEHNELSYRFNATIKVARDIAGHIIVTTVPSQTMLEQKRMALGLFLLAILLSLFVTAISAKWAQKIAMRIHLVVETLQIDDSATPIQQPADELEQLEQSVANLPLNLLKGSSQCDNSATDYEAAGLLYIRLNSLEDYVDTLDESSLLRYTRFQQQVIANASDLYGGELSVVRQFGLMVSFGGKHAAGSPVFRAASSAWIIQHLVTAMQPQVKLRLSMSLVCGISEAGAPNRRDIYPGLYSQHVIDELQLLAAADPTGILLTETACDEGSLSNKARLEPCEQNGAGHKAQCLQGFSEPVLDLLQRQLQLLLKQLQSG